MLRALLAACLIGAIGSLAAADRLVLLDGRSFTGVVTVEGQNVLIEMEFGTLRFPRDQVQRIELKDTPEAELAKKLTKTPLTDPDALVEVARWARDNALFRQAEEIYTLVLHLQPDHAEARRDQGFVRIDGKWREFDRAVELARGKLEAGRHTALLERILPAIAEAAGTRRRRVTVAEIRGLTQMRAGQFAAAGKTFAALAKLARDADAVRFAAIAEILASGADGMYLLAEPYPPSAALLGTPGKVLKAGPASLSDPMVLAAALRDKAKAEIAAGQKLLTAAEKLESAERGETAAVKAKYFQAAKAFDRAEALVPTIARPWRLRIVRRRIAAIRKSVAAGAGEFDAETDKLGKRDLGAQEYRAMLLRMVRNLDEVREALNEVLALARPYPRDLVMEIVWARDDLQKVARCRKGLLDEISGAN